MNTPLFRTLSLAALTLASFQTHASQIIHARGESQHQLRIAGEAHTFRVTHTTVESLCYTTCSIHDRDCYPAPYVCYESRSNRIPVFSHHIDAAVNVTVRPARPDIVVDQRMTVGLDEETLVVKGMGEAAPTTVKTQVTGGEIVRGVKDLKVEAELVVHDRAELAAALSISDASYSQGVLTYQTGPLSTLPIKHRVAVINQGGLFGGQVNFAQNLEGKLTTTPVAGGLRHEVNLRELGLSLKKGKNVFTLYTAYAEFYHDLTSLFIPGTSSGLELKTVKFTVRIR